MMMMIDDHDGWMLKGCVWYVSRDLLHRQAFADAGGSGDGGGRWWSGAVGKWLTDGDVDGRDGWVLAVNGGQG